MTSGVAQPEDGEAGKAGPGNEPRPVRFTIDGSLQLVGDAWGDPAHPCVVLLHGGGQTRHAWAGTAVSLAAAGWHAMAIDQRGHGESDWASDGNYDRTRYADDVIEIAQALPSPPVLVGASLGGIASLMAIHRASRPIARALVLVDIATRMEPEGLDRIFTFMQAAPDGFASLEEAADAIAAYNPHRPRPSDLRGLEKNLRRGADGRWRWHWDPRFLEQKIPAEPPQQWSALDDAARSLDLPTLLVRGRMSDILSEEGARVFLEQVPHAKFADISNAGHMVAGDRNDLFTNAVLEFLLELEGAA
ncbi:MAG TPA: alpha/beta hydrolase [Deltaproteobacteria bacterium]|nr:alpha/beta hydrolase [Deltaproteobacteria bacterium]